MNDHTKPIDLVLEGGGVKGIALLGAVLTLSDAGYRFERIAGTSAGAIVAALVTAYQRAGRDLHQLEKVMSDLEYQRFAEPSRLERVAGTAGAVIETVVHGGGHSGDYLTDWLGPLLEEVGVRTFADLRIDDPDSTLRDYQKYTLVVHASDLSRRVLVRLPWDYSHYGKDADDELVVNAVRASMSIPFYFRPVEVETEDGAVTWVDGGLLSNFPITVFDRTDGRLPRWPTWGVRLSGRPVVHDERVRTGPGIAIGCLRTLMADWNQYRLDDEGVGRRTMQVDTNGVSATDFGISPESQRKLFESGQDAARKFLRMADR
jgi:NTE family protein